MTLLDVLPEYQTSLSPDQTFQMADRLHRDGRWNEAAGVYCQVLTEEPDHFRALCGLGTVSGQLGQFDLAASVLGRAADLAAESVDAQIRIGLILVTFERFEDAIVRFQRALEIEPRNAEANLNLANALSRIDRPQSAIAHYQAALALAPNHAEADNGFGYEVAIASTAGYFDAHCNLGNALLALDRSEDAIAEYQKALAIDPSRAELYNKIATAHTVMGRLQDAYEACESGAALAPEDAVIELNHASLKSLTIDDPRLVALQELAERTDSLSEKGQIALHFALGSVLADLDQSERSFQHLLKGNALRRRAMVYDEESELSGLQMMQSAMSGQLMWEKRGAGNPSDVPVFIVGMPRSGTTLLEQILASHSAVHGAGEIDTFSQSVASIMDLSDASERFSEFVTAASSDQLQLIGQRYIDAIQAVAPDAGRIVDKMPSNFAYAGLIHMALPNARIIHARRDPIDACLSSFVLPFAKQPYTYHLAELGRYYLAYERLMRHWQSVLPKGVMIDVHYEDVIDDPEGQARRIIAHCGLDWEDQCLSFYERQRPVRAAGVAQVRRPIYRESVERWREYKDLLRPLLKELELTR